MIENTNPYRHGGDSRHPYKRDGEQSADPDLPREEPPVAGEPKKETDHGRGEKPGKPVKEQPVPDPDPAPPGYGHEEAPPSPAEAAALTNEPCSWHRDRKPVNAENGEYCPQGCGLLAVEDCKGCGRVFLDWSVKGYDDVVAGPYVTASGDLGCMKCGPAADRTQDAARKDEFRISSDDGNNSYPAPEPFAPSDQPTAGNAAMPPEETFVQTIPVVAVDAEQPASSVPIFDWNMGRSYLLAQAKQVYSDLARLTGDISAWNAGVQSEDQRIPFDDGDARFARWMFRGLNVLFVREALAKMNPEQAEWRRRYVERLAEQSGSRRFAEASFVCGFVKFGVVDLDLSLSPEIAADNEYRLWD